VKSKGVRINGAAPVKCYELDALRPVFATYLEPIVSGVSVNPGVDGPSLPVTVLDTLDTRPTAQAVL
jgi:hypothetical protein